MNLTNATDVFIKDFRKESTKAFDVVQGIGGTVGAITCLLNCLILCYVRRLLLRRPSGSTIQLAAVSANDLLNGFTLLSVSVIKVVDRPTIAACAVVVNFATTCFTVSRINILFVSIQKFLYVRKLEKVRAPWRKAHTLGLVGVNVSLWTLLLITNQVTTLTHLLPVPVIQLCNPLAVFQQNVTGIIPAMTFMIETVVIILANVLSVTTVWKLKTPRGTVHPDSTTATTSSTSSAIKTDNSQRMIGQTVQRNRKGAITLSLVVLPFDVSLLVALTGMGLHTIGLHLTPIHFQWIYIATFANAILSPIVILARTQDLKLFIQKDANDFKRTIINCFR